MTTTFLARIQEVLHGHSDRALIRAVGIEGHEIKVEVPLEAARGLTSDHVLMVSWSAHAIPAGATSAEPDEVAPTTPPTSSPADTPSSDALTTGPSPGARQLANLIGLKLE